VFVNVDVDRTRSAGTLYGPKQRFAVFAFTRGLLSVYAPEFMTISKSRASSMPSFVNADRAFTRAESDRVVSIASSILQSSLAGRPVKYVAIAVMPSTLVYDFVP